MRNSDQVPFVVERATYYSNASTLFQSGRSTPVASSISSSKGQRFPVSHDAILDQSLSYLTEPTMWPMHTASTDGNHLQSSVGQGTLHEYHIDPNAAEPASKQFFCTFCFELGIQKIIKRKEDWKRHIAVSYTHLTLPTKRIV